MRIEQPTELASCIAQNEELAAKVAEFEAMAIEFDTTKASLFDVTAERDVLQSENTELKEAIAASAEVGEQIKQEVAKNVQLADELKAAEIEFAEAMAGKETEVTDLKEKADAFAELAAKYAEEKKSVQDQFALLSEHLQLKGKIPETVEAGAVHAAPESYSTWKKLSASRDPEDRRLARKMMKDDPEILAQITKESVPVTSTPTVPVPDFSEDQMKVFKDWKVASANADLYDKTKQYTLHVEAKTAARRIYKQHQPTIDACIAAGLSA